MKLNDLRDGEDRPSLSTLHNWAKNWSRAGRDDAVRKVRNAWAVNDSHVEEFLELGPDGPVDRAPEQPRRLIDPAVNADVDSGLMEDMFVATQQELAAVKAELADLRADNERLRIEVVEANAKVEARDAQLAAIAATARTWRAQADQVDPLLLGWTPPQP